MKFPVLLLKVARRLLPLFYVTLFNTRTSLLKLKLPTLWKQTALLPVFNKGKQFIQHF
jgi:hypothetical protein